MNFLPRLLGLGLLAVLASLLLLTGCESTRNGVGETATPSKSSSMGSEANVISRPIAQLEGGKTTFKIPQATLAAAFIRQFGDGTVIDKIMVRKAPAEPDEPAVCFLVGLGLKDGNFRAMAVPLVLSPDGGTYYLNASAARYVITGVGCPACFFNFDQGGSIDGTTCSENSDGGTCNLNVLAGNSLLTSQ